MTETPELDEIEYGDYDLVEDVTPVETTEALPYPDNDVTQDPSNANTVQPFMPTAVPPRTPEQAIAVARSMSARAVFVGVGNCLITVRGYYAVAAKYGTATLCWQAADHKHPVSHGVNVPRGTPVYWTGGSHGFGHIAISIGGGLCLSTDWLRAGRIDVARIDDITSHWGLNFEGYANEVNDVEVWKPVAATKSVSLRNLKYNARNRDVKDLKKRLKQKGYKGFWTGSSKFGHGLRKAYASYQRKLGYSGAAANGIPGEISLKKLGFKVRP